MPVIKMRDLPPLRTADLGASLDEATELPRRVPGARVRRAPGEGEPKPAPVRGVLRGAHLAARAVELEVFTPDVAFPLPPVEEPEPQPAPEPEASAAEQVAAALAEQEAAWEARLAAETAAAREAGRAEGEAAAREALEADYAEAIAAYGDDLGRLEALWRGFIDDAEPLLAALAFEIAETILEAPLPPPLKTVSARALTGAVEALAASAPLEITLHPVDLLRLRESGVAEHLDRLHSDLRWSPDPDVIQGDWAVQAPDAAFRRLQHELVATLRHRLGVAIAELGEAEDAPPEASPEPPPHTP